MAYQPKSYRKFVATAATATLVASAVAPFASAAELSDISGHRFAKEITTLVDKGVISGYPDGTFQPEKQVTRAEAAIMIAKSLDLIGNGETPVSPFTDVAKDAKAYEAISKLAAKGIITGFDTDTYKPGQVVSRGEMAIILTKAFKLEEGDGEGTPFSDVSSKTSSGKYVEALYNAKVTSGKTTTSFGVNDATKRGDFARFVFVAGGYDVVAPVVESVSANNAKDVNITFNNVMDKVTVENETNYEVKVNNGTALATTDYTVTLDATNPKIASLVLTDAAAANLTNGSTVTVKVTKSVLDSKLQPLAADFTRSFVFTDTTAPSIVKVEKSGNDLKVTFNEYVTAVGQAKVNGVQVTPVVAAAGSRSKEVTLTNGAVGLGNGTHNVQLANVSDLAFPTVNTASFLQSSLVISDDALAPTVSKVEKVDQDTLKITFDKAVSAPTVAVKKNGIDLTAGTATVVALSGNTQYTVDVSDFGASKLYGTGETTATLTVNISGFKATVNNLIGNPVNTSVVLSKDTSAPVVETRYSQVVDADPLATVDEVFQLRFAEDIANLDATKIVFTDKNGVRQTATATIVAPNLLQVKSTAVQVASGADTGKVVTGTYSISLGAGTVKDTAGNSNAATTVSVVKSGSATGDLTPTVNAASNVITVAYGTDMTNTATTLANYKLDNNNLPAGSVIYFDSTTQTVKIELPKGSVSATGGGVVTISPSVLSTTGAKVAAASQNQVVASGFVDNVDPLLVSARKVDSTHVELTFSEALATQATNTSALYDDVNVKVNGSTIAVTGNTAVAAGEKKLVLTVDAYNTTQTLTVTSSTESTTPVLTVNLTDATGVNKVIGGTTVTAGN